MPEENEAASRFEAIFEEWYESKIPADEAPENTEEEVDERRRRAVPRRRRPRRNAPIEGGEELTEEQEDEIVHRFFEAIELIARIKNRNPVLVKRDAARAALARAVDGFDVWIELGWMTVEQAEWLQKEYGINSLSVLHKHYGMVKGKSEETQEEHAEFLKMGGEMLVKIRDLDILDGED